MWVVVVIEYIDISTTSDSAIIVDTITDDTSYNSYVLLIYEPVDFNALFFLVSTYVIYILSFRYFHVFDLHIVDETVHFVQL